MEWQAGERVVRVPVGETTLDGNLTLPASPIGVVLFATALRKATRHCPWGHASGEAFQGRAGSIRLERNEVRIGVAY